MFKYAQRNCVFGLFADWPLRANHHDATGPGDAHNRNSRHSRRSNRPIKRSESGRRASGRNRSYLLRVTRVSRRRRNGVENEDGQRSARHRPAPCSGFHARSGFACERAQRDSRHHHHPARSTAAGIDDAPGDAGLQADRNARNFQYARRPYAGHARYSALGPEPSGHARNHIRQLKPLDACFPRWSAGRSQE